MAAMDNQDIVVVDLDTFIEELFKLLAHSWKSLARKLGFSETDIAALQHDNPYNLKEQIYQMFNQWKKTEGNGATKERLLLAMMSAGCFAEEVKALTEKGVIKRSSAGLACSLAAGVRFPIQASDDAHTDSPVRAKTAPTVPSTKTSSGEIEFIRQQRLKRLTSSTSDKSNPVDTREQRESDDSPLSPLQAPARVESALPCPTTTVSSHTSVTSDASATCMTLFEVNEMIQVDRPDSAPWYGVIRWIGKLPGSTTLLAGIEMEMVVEGGRSGSFQDVTYFSCPHGHGIFLPLSRLRKDTRFLEADDSETSASEPVASQHDGDSASTTDTKDPLSDLLSKLMGDSKGAAPPDPEPSGPKGYELQIPADRAGLVIGTGGKNIREVERLTNTIIKVDRGFGCLGGQNRKVSVIGSEDNCKKALLMILRNVERRVGEHTAGAKTISVPDSLVGRIIGKGGATVSTIKSLSGAQDIKFDDKKVGLEAMLQTERKCYIHGSEEAIGKAEKLIRLAMTGEDIVAGASFAAIIMELLKLGVQCQEESS